MEEKFRIFQANLKQTVPPKAKGKGRGKKSTLNENQFSDQVSKEAERRLRSFLQSSGVNFINNLLTAFALVDSKSVKILLSHQWLFTLLGFTSVKAVRITLMKLSPEASTSTPSLSAPNVSENFEPSAPPLEAGYWTEDNSSVSGSQASVSMNSRQKVGATEKVYILNIEVTLNGTPIDQVLDQQNEDECMQAYWRMFTFNGQMNSLFTNGIRNDIIIYMI